MEGTRLDGPGRMEVIALVDDFVFGHAVHTIMDETEMLNDQWRERAAAYVRSQLDSGEFPHIRALVGLEDPDARWPELTASLADEERFERGLAALLDGIALRIALRTA